MLVFESFLALLLCATLATALARRLGIPYPVFLALGGAALAFVPGIPPLTLRPDLALALFIAPVLLDAAFDSSPRDLKDNWVSVAGLVFVAVGLTTAAVAVVARWLVPEMPWAAAIALGAIVAPPDAAAATAVLRQARLPHRLLTILEGESLLNDASALLIYRVAVTAAMSGTFVASSVAPIFAYAVVGSIVFGVAAAWFNARIIQKIQDAPSSIIAQFGSTFAVWIVAERLGLSSILTIVVYAIMIARSAPLVMPARLRVPSFAFWETAVFILNVLAFVLIGLQIRPIWERLDPGLRGDYVVFALAVLTTVIGIRIVWAMSYGTVLRLKTRRYGFHPPRPTTPPSLQSGVVIAWCGMRGIVTLAAAYALPAADGNGQGAFPYRDLILLTAFAVVLGTLVLQGLTLKPLLGRLHLIDNDPVGREFMRARVAAYDAALAAINDETSSDAETLRREYEERRLYAAKDGASDRIDASQGALLRRRAITAARRTGHAMRERGEIGDAAYRRLEQELDWAELSAIPQDTGDARAAS